MRRGLIYAAGAAIVAAAVMPAGGAMDSKAEVPRARDGNIAIEQELCAARKARSVAAYDLFIARHPNHPLASVARREREALAAEAKR
jgi:hypothetical protein